MIPYAILSGHIFYSNQTEEEIRILDLSTDNFTFRLPKRNRNYDGLDSVRLESEIEKIDLNFFSFQDYTYHPVTLSGSREIQIIEITPEKEDSYADYFRVEVTSDDFSSAAKKLTSDYLCYVHLKLEKEDNDLSQALVGYPASEDQKFARSLEEWRTQCFSGIHFTLPEHFSGSVAWNLDTPELYEKFLKLSWKDLQTELLAAYYLDSVQLTDFDKIDSICIGNQFDHRLFPSDECFRQLLAKCTAQKLQPVILFPPMSEEWIPEFFQILQLCKDSGVRELIVNDWGLLELIREHFPDQFQITLGVLLNKRKKDMRLSYKKGSETQAEFLKQNTSNAVFYQKALAQRYQISGFACESCQYPYEFSEGDTTFFLPYYQMNTGGSADQNQGYLFYPNHLHMIGRNNTLYGFDRKILTDTEYLNSFLEQKPARIVLTLL